MAEAAKIAVITGGHSYDVPGFHRLFAGMPSDLEIYLQHMDDFASSPAEVRRGYDAVLFYTMLVEGPCDDGLPWYAGRPLTALGELGETGQGVVVLHHAVLAYPDWPVWSDLVGMADRHVEVHADQRLEVRVADPQHPITAGLGDWEMTDETYAMGEPDPTSRILLSVDNPRSMRHIAWARQHRQGRVFVLQSGHDRVAWECPGFRTVLERGIRWCARRL